MDAKLINPFLAALLTVLPQLGFTQVERKKVFTKDQFMDGWGITVQVALTHQLEGNIVFTMTQDAAKRISSTIMLGAPVETLDDMAVSALCEMVNMITSNAATALNKDGITVRLTPPALSQGISPFKFCNQQYIGIELDVDQLPLAIGIGIN